LPNRRFIPLELGDHGRKFGRRPDAIQPGVHCLLDPAHRALELSARRGQLEDDLATVASIRGRAVDQTPVSVSGAWSPSRRNTSRADHDLGVGKFGDAAGNVVRVG
jgi:hypothetical protein